MKEVMNKKSNKKTTHEREDFNINEFRAKYRAHFDGNQHVENCNCTPKLLNGCPFKANFGSNMFAHDPVLGKVLREAEEE